MKLLPIIAAAMLSALAAPASAKTIDASVSGTWWNATQDGHGFSVEYLNPTITLIYWYVYTPEGAPTFLVIAAVNDGMTATGDASIQEGMIFGEFDPISESDRTNWGTVSFTYNNCNSATLTYDSTVPGYGSGSIQLTKLIGIAGLKCTENAVHGNYAATVLNDFDGNVTSGRAIMFEDGSFAWSGSDEESGNAGFGTWTLTSDSAFSFNGNTYDQFDGGATPLSGTGTLNANGFAASLPQEELSAVRTPDFQRAVGTGDIAGTWDLFDTAVNSTVGTLTVQADGSAQGDLLADCLLSGSISSPKAGFNQLKVNLDVTGCAGTTDFVGAAWWDPEIDQFRIVGNDGFYGYSIILQ